MGEPLGPEVCGFCVTGNQALCYRHGPPEVRAAGQRVREEAEARHGLASAPYDCAKPRPLRWCEVPGNLCSVIPVWHRAHPDYVEPQPAPAQHTVEQQRPDTDHTIQLRARPRAGMSRLAAIVALAQMGVLHAPRDRSGDS